MIGVTAKERWYRGSPRRKKEIDRFNRRKSKFSRSSLACRANEEPSDDGGISVERQKNGKASYHLCISWKAKKRKERRKGEAIAFVLGFDYGSRY